MKNTLSILLFMLSITCFSQSSELKISNEDVKFENLKIKLTIDSAESLKTFNLNEIESIFKDSEANEPLQLEVVCKDNSVKNTTNQMMSYKINGNSNDIKAFMKNAKKMKKAIKKYYKNRA